MFGVRDKKTKEYLFFYTRPPKAASCCIAKSIPSSLEVKIANYFCVTGGGNAHYTLDEINESYPMLFKFIKDKGIPFISLCRNPYDRFHSIKNYHLKHLHNLSSREEFLNSLKHLYTEQWKYFIFDDEQIVTHYKIEETKSLFGFDLVKANVNNNKQSPLTDVDREFVREFYKHDFTLFDYQQ